MTYGLQNTLDGGCSFKLSEHDLFEIIKRTPNEITIVFESRFFSLRHLNIDWLYGSQHPGNPKIADVAAMNGDFPSMELFS